MKPPQSGTASPLACFPALEGWSAELATRMNAVDEGIPQSDDLAQHAAYYHRRIDAWLALSIELGDIEPAPETTDAHLELLAGLQGVLELDARIIESLEADSSASEVFDGPLSAEMELAGGRVLGSCRELLDVARQRGIQAELFCGATEE